MLITNSDYIYTDVSSCVDLGLFIITFSVKFCNLVTEVLHLIEFIGIEKKRN